MNKIRSTALAFRSGMLLSKEILEQMDAQSHLFKIQYHSYPNGIIYGFELLEENGMLYLTPGLIKLHEKYYFSSQKTSVSDLLDQIDRDKQTSDTFHSTLAFVPSEKEIENEGIVSDCLELQLLTQNKTSLDPDAVIIAEFQYFSQKRKWRTEKQNAPDRLHSQLCTTGEDYSFLNASYCLPYEKVFSPAICRMMRECLEYKTGRTAADTMLLLMLSQHRTVSMDVLENWFRENHLPVHGFESDDRKEIIRTFLAYINSEPVHDEPPAEPPKSISKQKRTFGI